MKRGIIRTAARVLRQRPGLLCFPALGRWVAGGLKLLVTTTLVVIGAIVVLILAVEANSLAVLFAAVATVMAVGLLVTVVNSAASGIYRTSLYRETVATAGRGSDGLLLRGTGPA